MNSLFRNSIFNFLSQTVIFLSAFILSVFLARILGPEQMGQYSYWMWIIGAGGILLTLGLPRSLMRFCAEYKFGNESVVKKIISRSFIYQLKILALISVISVILIVIFGGNLKLTYLIILGTLLVAVSNSIFGSILSGLQKYDLLLKINLLISPLTFILSIIVLLFYKNINNLLLVNLVFSLLSLLISIYYLRDYLNFKSKKMPDKVFSKIRNYTFSISVIVFLDLILMERSEIFFLNTFSSLEQVAFYSIGFGLVGRVMTLIPGAVSGVIMPKIAWLHGQKDSDRINLTYYSSTRYLILITMPIIFAGIVLINLPVQIFYGNEYLTLVPVTSILLISGGLSAIVASAAAVLYGTGNQNFILKLAGLAAAVNILLDILFIPAWGAVGAAVANFLAQIVGVVIGTFYLTQIKKMSFPWRDGLKVLFASSAAGISIFIIKEYFFKTQSLILLVILSIIYLVLYFVLLRLFKFFIKQDRDIFQRLVNKFPILENIKP